MSKTLPSTLKILPLLAALSLAGCTTVASNIYHSPTGQPPPLTSKVLILPPEVVIYLKNAGGNNEPRADWSDIVQTNLSASLTEYMFEQAVEVVPYPHEDISDDHMNAIRQAAVMMDAVELSQMGGGSVGGTRVYALGAGTIESLSPLGADYVLVTEMSSEVASSGRVAVAVLGALAGVSTSMSSAQFRVGLFDLRDGQIIWANNDRQALADIGNVVQADSEGWSKAVEHILSEFPL